jgi:hypothetical protein
MRMLRALRLLAAVISVMVGGGVALAQTVVVRKATPGSAVEVVLNATKAGSGTVDAAGDASVPFRLAPNAERTGIDANVFVDVCDKLYRVLIVERGQATVPEEASCERRAVSGLFLVRGISTVVVHVDSQIPSLLLIQGSYSLTPEGPGGAWSEAPTGLVLFGGAGMAKYSNAVALACGDVSSCSGDSSWGALTAGFDYWLMPFLAAEATYVKPAQLDISGTGNNFSFNSFTDAYVLTISGKAGVPFGPFRLYGRVGANYHQATLGTTQTAEDVTMTVDGVPQTVAGGTQRFQLRTAGWGWTFGGGLEVWATPRVGIYGEVGRLALKGAARDDAEGEMDDGLTSVLFGMRFRIWR